MPRRVTLPGADELFRTTGGTGLPPAASRAARTAPADGAERPHALPAPSPAPEDSTTTGAPAQRGALAPAPRSQQPAPAHTAEPRATGGRAAGRRRRRERQPSGRERHDEKITVYVSAEELIDLEQARLMLRGEHGLAVDRGRIVREAVAVVLADLESRGDASILVRRLRDR